MKGRTLRAVLLALGLAALGLGGRALAEVLHIDSNGVEGSRERTSISAVIGNLAVAYRTRDISLYREQYHPDFVYLAEQPKGDRAGEERKQVTHAQDVEAVTRLFRDVKWMECEITYETPAPSTVDGFPADQHFWEVRVQETDLQLEAIDPPQVFSVNSGPATLVFKDFGTAETSDWRLVFHRNDE